MLLTLLLDPNWNFSPTFFFGGWLLFFLLIWLFIWSVMQVFKPDGEVRQKGYIGLLVGAVLVVLCWRVLLATVGLSLLFGLS